MLYYGENITKSNTEILKPKSVFEIYREISECDTALSDLILRIRKVAKLDRRAYQSLKKQLPFFSGSCFGDMPRCSENFQYATCFIIDIDKCYENEGQFIELRSRLAADPRVNLIFTSPGGSGIKLVFELDSPCRSTKFFSDAYRSFAYQFARDINLQEKIDLATHDATRVCFMSYDRNAWYNAIPEKVSWKAYLPAGDLVIEENIDTDYGVQYTIGKDEAPASNCSNDISPEIYKSILQKLNPGRKYPAQRNYYVPEILNLIEEPVREAVRKHSITVSEIRNIQYGKKFCFSHTLHKAELNIYYGKKGFSVVISPSGGTNADLNKIVYSLVSELIYTPKFIIRDQDLPQTSI